MTDKELLELSAKAAGIRLEWGGETWMPPNQHWNPLTNDGDALRLAVKLNMGISIPIHQTIKADVVCFSDSRVNIREEGNDPYAATRRAIVRVAAEIGRGME
jgi:hypothetical protein